MYDALTVDVTPRTNLKGWNWGEFLVAFAVLPNLRGKTKMVPVMATSNRMMTVVPAHIEGGMAVIAPQHASLAPQLFEREIGISTRAALAASMATRMRQINLTAGANRQRYMEEETFSLFLQCAKVAPVFTFAALVNPYEECGRGAGIMFCGKPWDRYENRMGLDMAAATLLNDPWHRTEVAPDLTKLARQANEAARAAIPCFTRFRTREAAMSAWYQLMVEADRLARQFLADNLLGWTGQPVTFTPTAVPWMATPHGVGKHIGLGHLPVPEPHLRVGGCHIELAA